MSDLKLSKCFLFKKTCLQLLYGSLHKGEYYGMVFSICLSIITWDTLALFEKVIHGIIIWLKKVIIFEQLLSDLQFNKNSNVEICCELLTTF